MKEINLQLKTYSDSSTKWKKIGILCYPFGEDWETNEEI
jgi:hypothetical protein